MIFRNNKIKILHTCLFIMGATVCLSITSHRAQATDLTSQANRVVEWSYKSEKNYDNPFRDVKLEALITNKGNGDKRTISAFWAGGNIWKFRFSSPTTGDFSFKTLCSDIENPGLHGKSGIIAITPYAGDNPLYKRGPIQVSENGNYLEHHDGTPFFWLADSWWHGMTTRLPFPHGFTKLAQDRKQKGFTVIQFAVSFPCDIHPFDPRGQNEAGDPWDTAFTQMNPSYFDATDKRIEKLLDLGLMPNIVGLWGYYMKWMGPDNVKKHWEYLMARYGAYPVTYTLSGETTLAYYSDLADNWDKYKHQFRQQWSEVAAFIQRNDPYNRLLTTHAGPGIWDGKPPIYEMQHLDLIMLQSGHSGFATVPASNMFIERFTSDYPDHPVIHGEVCFEGMAGSSWNDVQRLLFWSNVLQGTPGYSYGVEGIWQFNTKEKPFGKSPQGSTWGNVPWTEAMHYRGSTHLGYGAQFLQSLEWWKLQPCKDCVNEHGSQEEIYKPYASSLENGVMVYFTKLGFSRSKLEIQGLSPDLKYEYVFFDPINGQVHPAQRLEPDPEGNWKVPDPPVMQDWVIWVRPAGHNQKKIFTH